MADQLTLEIVTPERLVISQPVDEVILPSVEGYMGVRPGHTALLAQLDVGEVSYRIGSEEKLVAVSGGFAEVQQAGVSILAETAEPAEEIDLDRAERARDDAETRLKSGLSQRESSVAALRLRRAVSRIQVRGRIR